MPEPKVFKFRQPGERHRNYGTLPIIDKTRATAVLVRQSKDEADIESAESREAQLNLQYYAALLYGDHTPNVRLYDEGAGVSGQKRIDQREELDRLYRDIKSGIVGTIILGREDRAFRNKHMDQVGTFTKLAEEMKVKLIVPPVSASSDVETRVYDFTMYQHLLAFQEKMKEAYGYIPSHVEYMNQCQQEKADKGGYDGRNLPPGLVVKGKKQDQTLIIYEPWAQVLRTLALRAQALDWDMGKLNREVEKMTFLFPDVPEEDRERYLIKTVLPYTPGVGYRAGDSQTIKRWLTNVMYIGWWQPEKDKPDIITNHHAAILDYTLFAEGYARLTGYTLEGEPVDSKRGVTRVRKTRDESPDALFHGRLIVIPPSPERTTYVSIQTYYGNLYYQGCSRHPSGMAADTLFVIPAGHFDTIVIERLQSLVKVDNEIKDTVKTTLEQVHTQQSEDFVSIHEQLKGIDIQLKANARKIVDENDEELEKKLRAKRTALLATKQELEAKKEKLGIIDSPEEIERVHTLLSNFDKAWPTFDVNKRQRVFSLLMNRIEVAVISPHWVCLSIDWLNALCPRIDVAYVWRAIPARGEPFSDQEKEIIAQQYPCSPQLDLLKLLPTRTWGAIQHQAEVNQIKKTTYAKCIVPSAVCYQDILCNGHYLLRDHETTLAYIKKARSNTAKKTAPLYAIWLLSEKVEDSASLAQLHMREVDQLTSQQ